MVLHRSLFGTSVSIRLPPQRVVVISCIVVVFVGTVFLLSPRANAPPIVDLQDHAKKVKEILSSPNLPKLWNPFGDAVHQPSPEYESSLGDTQWYAQLKWLHPFSSQVTLDADHALLPPLPHRTRIYTFYVPSNPSDAEIVDAENKLLLSWRRAWWAEGFKPMVLGLAEAKKHADYDKIAKHSMDPAMAKDLEKWLAWAHVGTGCLVDWLSFPMAELDDDILSALRDPNWIQIRKYDNTKNVFVCGNKEHVENAIDVAFKERGLSRLPRVLDLIPYEYFETMHQNSIAFYDEATIGKLYPMIAEQLRRARGAGLRHLQGLVNAHLHANWQKRFPSGLSVLRPFDDEMSSVYSVASDLAARLAHCPNGPVPDSCPPNRANCKPCKASSALRIATPSTFDDKGRSFLLGTTPHPYTFTSLHYGRDEITAKFLRRETDRDLWLIGATKTLLGSSISGPQRLLQFKDFVANQRGSLRSLWLTAEGEEVMEPNWLLGFELPSKADIASDSSKSQEKDKGLVGAEVQQATERALFQLAKKKVKDKEASIIKAAEAWNLADWEAWRFVRAFATQRSLERRDWEKEEKAFAGSERKSMGWTEWR